MNAKKRKLKARETWIKIYEELGSVSKTARRCGIPRSTLYRWINRYDANNKNSLADKSQKPLRLARQKITKEIEELILSIRHKHNFGPQSISTHLLRNYEMSLSPPTVWRVLSKHDVKPLKRYRKNQEIKRYNRPLPGDRVQMDVMKVRAKSYQFTAVDDCTRLRVIRLYSSKHAENTVKFLYEVIENIRFPIQRIQTDWGTEFYNELFQEELMIHFIKFRPIKPRSPHLNGKVERSQKTDKAEFYSQLNLRDKDLQLEPLLAEWEHFYNHDRPHASLNGKTPYERYLELENLIPTQGEVTGKYWEKPEDIRPRNYQYLTLVKKLGMSQMS
jgi:transposase InsO family protein